MDVRNPRIGGALDSHGRMTATRSRYREERGLSGDPTIDEDQPFCANAVPACVYFGLSSPGGTDGTEPTSPPASPARGWSFW